MCVFNASFLMYKRKDICMRISLSEAMNLKSEIRKVSADIEMEKFLYMGDEYDIIRKEPVQFSLLSVTAKTLQMKAHIVLQIEAPCSSALL